MANRIFFWIPISTNKPYIFETSILMDPNRYLYQRTVFSIIYLSGTIGGIFGLLSSAWGFVVGIISTQIMLSSVFRRINYNIDKRNRHHYILIFNYKKWYKLKSFIKIKLPYTDQEHFEDL